MFLASALQSTLALYASTSNLSRAKALQVAPQLQHRRSDARPGVSVIVLNRDRPEFIIPLLDQLLLEQQGCTRQGLAMEIIVGDTGSSDVAVLRRCEQLSDRIRVCFSPDYHFSENNNHLFFECSSCDTVLFLNNDIILPSTGCTVFEVYSCLHNNSLDVLGAVLFFPDGSIQHCGIEFLREPAVCGLPFHPHAREFRSEDTWPLLRTCPAVTGACLMIRSELFESIGGFDPAFRKELQDVDLCLAVHRTGGRIGVGRFGRIVHVENGTRPKGEESWPERQAFLRRWGNYIDACFL